MVGSKKPSPLTLWRCLTLAMLSIGTIRFEDRFCASKKGEIGGGRRVSARSTADH